MTTASDDALDSQGRACVRPVVVGLTAGLAAMLVFGMSASPGVLWQDSGVHQFRIVAGRLENPLGLALSHPLHYWLGRAVIQLPFSDPAYGLNLMSGLFGAIGVGVLAAIVMMLTARVLPAALAAATLALAHSYWQMSAVTETYTLAAALMTVEWLFLLHYVRRGHPWFLVGVFVANGLHVADHLLGVLTLVTYSGLLIERVVRRRIDLKWTAAVLVAWIVAASPYWTLVAAHWRISGDLGATLHSAFFGVGVRVDVGEERRGYIDHVLNLSISFALLRNAVLTFGYNFPFLAAPLALIGLTVRRDKPLRTFRVVLIAQTIIITTFVGRYSIQDQYTFFVPVCVVLALWFGLGCERLLRPHRGRQRDRALKAMLIAGTMAPVLVYAVFPALARQEGWLRSRMRDILYRDEYSHFFQPWKLEDDSAEVFARDLLRLAGPNGWVLTDMTAGFATAYVQRVHGGPASPRVFVRKICVSDSIPWELTADELRRHLEMGGKVVAVPDSGVVSFWGDEFAIDKSGRFWRVHLLPDSTDEAGGSRE